MPANKARGVPKPFPLTVIQHKFPPERPIFWGPNQETTYPDIYNPPKDWRDKEALHIPEVVRFIVGGRVPNRFIQRYIYIGHQRTEIVTWQNASTTCLAHPYNKFYSNFEDFIFDGEDLAAYGANKTAAEAVDEFVRIAARQFSNSDQPGNTWLDTTGFVMANTFFDCEFEVKNESMPEFVQNSGSVIGPPDIRVETSTPNWWVPHGIGEHDVTVKYAQVPFGQWVNYFWLRNTIIGSTQTNFLFLVSTTGSTPELGWDSPDPTPVDDPGPYLEGGGGFTIFGLELEP